MRKKQGKDILGIFWMVLGAVLMIIAWVHPLSEIAILTGFIALLGGTILFYLPTENTPTDDKGVDTNP